MTTLATSLDGRSPAARPRMLFNSPVYGVFLLVTYVAFWALRRPVAP